MMKRFGMIVGVLVAALVSACTYKTDLISPVDHHTSQIAVDWAGSYVGHLPCADCEAIHWQLSLYDDYSFNLVREYIGRSESVIKDKGQFFWAEDGQRILLTTQAGEKLGFFVGENRIWLLDQENRLIEGKLTDLYKLIKK
ncbi:copper resistance protein NlpE [Thiomicrospira sp. ALE5]|uniref:copper resistance protein NlpE n=1 Tax=Thiomicrospira sp. ALE5 TaxID=748650 RepID=UPI0008E77FA5|nr:copper resistance protein NlpE [Thiomicrospira sp. ALE5]SFR54096.1 NlpE N-terminal domain-containing protein [Thiomicrospira sp. ALE5]